MRAADLRRGVNDLGRVDSGQRAAQDHPRGVAARLHAGQAHRLQRLPDRRNVLDPDPVQLDVLPVGDVRGAPGVPARDIGNGGKLGVVQLPPVDPDPHHEVAVVQLFGLKQRRLAPVDAGPALRVQAVPAEPAAQVGRVDRVEAVLGVNVDDPLPHIEAVVVLLVHLVGIERLVVAQCPLALTALAAGAAGRGRAAGRRRYGLRAGLAAGRRGDDRHEVLPSGSGACEACGARAIGRRSRLGAAAGRRPDQPVGENGERSAAGGRNRAANPEEIDVPPGDQHWIRVRNGRWTPIPGRCGWHGGMPASSTYAQANDVCCHAG